MPPRSSPDPRARPSGLVVLIVAAVLAGPPVAAAGEDVRVTDSVERYGIEGASVRQLRRAMRKNGPRRGGKRYDAYTAWEVRWQVGFDRADDACAVATADVDVVVTMTLPEWNRDADADERLVARWERYLEALLQHERNHRAFGVSAAREIRRRVGSIGTRASCDELESLVDAVASSVIERHRRRERTYDDETRHGAAEGVRLR